jgi:hypothetical protein
MRNGLKGSSMTGLWTSGSNEGAYCAEDDTFAWCSTGAKFSAHNSNDVELITNINNRKSTTDRCLMLDLASAKLSMANCEQKQSLVCEVRQFHETMREFLNAT